MNNLPLCEECDAGTLRPSEWAADFRHGEGTVHVGELECYICDQCGADPVFTDQIRRNQLRIADTKRRADKMLVGDEIRAVRQQFGLTQQEAAVLFGGGSNAFSKYERGDVMQSVAMDRLLKVAAFLPGVLEFLQFEAGLRTAGENRSNTGAYEPNHSMNLSDRSFTSRSVRGNVVEVRASTWTRCVAA